MNQDRDLLPWILGGLSMAAVAVAISVGSTGRTAPTNLPVPSQATAQRMPEATLTAAPAAPAAAPAPAPSTAAVQLPPLAPPAAPSNQIWECTTNGQRTFSDNPCGDKPMVREVGPINVMNSTPIRSPTREYGPESNDAPDYSYPSASYPSAPQSTDNAYPVFVGIPYNDHRRVDHPHHPNNHDRGRPRGN
jgi:hypothetical protein